MEELAKSLQEIYDYVEKTLTENPSDETAKQVKRMLRYPLRMLAEE